MAYIQPDTTVQFLNVPFDPDYENTMYWDTLAAQNAWMETRVILTIGNNSYQRKTRGVIRVGLTPIVEGATIRNLYNANYIRFKNSNYENKWFYAFVDQVEYVNNNTADVYYTIDVLQTWALDYSLLECFIERQHTITDAIGEHTVPEGLEHGEYFDSPCPVSSGSQVGNTYFQYSPAVCLITTFDAQGDYAGGRVIHGQATQGDMFSGLFYTIWELTGNNVAAINQTLEAITGNVEVITESGVKVPRFLADGVVALFMMPWEFAGSITGGSVSPEYNVSFDIRNNGSYTIGNYRPRNKKLLCYPYNMLYVSNNQGNDAELRWEDFNTPISCQCKIWGNVSPNGGLTFMPAGYKGYPGRNPNEMLQLTGFPMCSWSNDAYKAWVAQNAATLVASEFQSVWQTISPLAMSPSASAGETLAGATGGIVNHTLALMGQVYDHKRKAPQAHGNANTSLAYQSGLLTFYFYKKHIKEEYAKILDAFFDMYGYKVNMVGVPNRNARPCYTYIKTVGCAVDGLIPADDAQKIQSIFDKGIRFWKTTATFGIYSPLVNPNEVTIEG